VSATTAAAPIATFLVPVPSTTESLARPTVAPPPAAINSAMKLPRREVQPRS